MIEARANLPWPQRTPLPDGSVQVSGLSEDEIGAHIARHVIAGMARMPMAPEDLARAARAVFDRESDLIGEPGREQIFREGFALYAAVAEVGFRAILADILKE